MTAAAPSPTRMFHEVRGGRQARLEPDRLIREAHAVFGRAGVPVSPGRVIKLVRTYVGHVQGTGLAFGDYLDTQVEMSETQRHADPDELRKVVSYADYVGERAVNNVLKGQGRRR